MPELRKITEEDRRVIKLAEDMEGLMKFLPFRKYLEVLKEHEDRKRMELEQPTTDVANAMGIVLVAENIKGALAFAKLARTLPQVIIQEAKQRAAEVSLPDEEG